MQEVLLAHDAALRLSMSLGVFALIAGLELAAPRRRRTYPRRARWPGNLAIAVVDALAVRWLSPVAVIGLAAWAETAGWGLLNAIDAPPWIALAVSFVLLDLAIYAQHVVFHAVPPLWRLHRMHHADPDFDVTTGLRFHPFEILLSIAIKLGLVLVIGPPVVAVLLFEIVLNAASLFNHANLRIASGLDRALRWIVVTPDMHRVHHSIARRETNSNFGFNLPWWDRLFGTYRASPEAGHESMTIGLEDFRDRRALRLDRLLIQPFVGGARNEWRARRD